MSWIHEHDFNRIVERAICAPPMEGANIVSSPKPVSQDAFMGEVRNSHSKDAVSSRSG